MFLKLRKTSVSGVFAVGAKPPILEFLHIVRRTSDFGVLNIVNNIYKTTQNLRFWNFCSGRKTSDFGVFAYFLEVLQRAQTLQNRSNYIQVTTAQKLNN